MKLSEFFTDEEKAKQFFKLSCAFSAGCITMSLYHVRDYKRFIKQVNDRQDLVKKYREEIRRIMNDVTLSGSERERQIDDIIKFLDLILDQKLT